MKELLESDHYTINSKIRWLPALTKKFNVVDDNNSKIGEIIFHPAWMFPVLWLFGLVVELGMIVGGAVLIINKSKSSSMILTGVGLILVGLLFLFVWKFRNFLATRAPSTVEIRDSGNNSILTAKKGWAVWRPKFVVRKSQNEEIVGESQQSLFWGDLYYTLRDTSGQVWGSIRRRPLGFQYRVYKDKAQVARFRRKLIDTRKLITGLRSYLLEYQNSELIEDERALILGTLAYVDVLVRQKRLRKEKTNQERNKPKKKSE